MAKYPFFSKNKNQKNRAQIFFSDFSKLLFFLKNFDFDWNQIIDHKAGFNGLLWCRLAVSQTEVQPKFFVEKRFTLVMILCRLIVKYRFNANDGANLLYTKKSVKISDQPERNSVARCHHYRNNLYRKALDCPAQTSYYQTA